MDLRNFARAPPRPRLFFHCGSNHFFGRASGQFGFKFGKKFWSRFWEFSPSGNSRSNENCRDGKVFGSAQFSSQLAILYFFVDGISAQKNIRDSAPRLFFSEIFLAVQFFKFGESRVRKLFRVILFSGGRGNFVRTRAKIFAPPRIFWSISDIPRICRAGSPAGNLPAAHFVGDSGAIRLQSNFRRTESVRRVFAFDFAARDFRILADKKLGEIFFWQRKSPAEF